MPKKQSKPIKIKRYRNSLAGTSNAVRIVKKVVLWLVALAVLFFGGYFLTKWGLSTLQRIKVEEGQSSSYTASESEESSTGSAISGEEGTAGVQNALAGGQTAATITLPELTEQTAKALADAGITVAVLTIKDENGTLYLQVPGEFAEAAIAPGAITVQQLRSAKEGFAAQGVTLAVRICAYKDPIAPHTSRSAAVWFQGQENVLWLDNEPSAGGKPWLSPYSGEAQKYIKDILNEVLTAEIDNVIIAWLQFPQVYSLGYTGYGAAAAGVPMNKVLQNTTGELMSLAEKAGATAIFEYPSDAASGTNLVSYTENPLTFGASAVLLRIAGGEVENAKALIDAAKAAGAQVIGVYVSGVQATDAGAGTIATGLSAAGAGFVLFGS